MRSFSQANIATAQNRNKIGLRILFMGENLYLV
jgi:hypothetical protein